MFERARRDLFERPARNLHALDGLRALAVLCVLLFHCAIFSAYATPAHEAAGKLALGQRVLLNLWSGVDVFFVLSGFLIGGILLRDLATSGRVFYASFFVRRSLRIFPIYYFYLLLTLVAVAPYAPRLYSYLWGTVDVAALWANSWTNFLYLNNYLLAPGEANPLSWSWSLCIEEHFYILLPPLLWATLRSPNKGLHAFGLALGLFGPALARALAWFADPGLSTESIYHRSHFRFDELFVGVVVAYAHVHAPEGLASATRRLGLCLPFLGALAVASVWCFGSASEGGVFRIWFQFPLMAWGTAALLLHGIYCTSPLTRFLSAEVWYPIARVSYGIYLVHPILIFALLAGPFRGVFETGPSPAQLLGLACASFALSWGVSALLFLSFESPILQLGGRWSRQIRSRS